MSDLYFRKYCKLEEQLRDVEQSASKHKEHAQSLADALEFYAERDNHAVRYAAEPHPRMKDDLGEKARAALANYRKGE